MVEIQIVMQYGKNEHKVFLHLIVMTGLVTIKCPVARQSFLQLRPNWEDSMTSLLDNKGESWKK